MSWTPQLGLRYISLAEARELGEIYDVRVQSRRLRRSFYDTSSGQTGSSLIVTNLTPTPEPALIFNVKAWAHLDTSPASVPTNISVQSSAYFYQGTAGGTEPWGAMGDASDRFVEGAALLHMQAMNLESLLKPPLLVDRGWSLNWDLSVRTQAATTWNLFYGISFDYLPVALR